jgi:catechol 2,3-dioxygenase
MSQISKSAAYMRPTLHHINLKTLRLQEMIDWYATVLGMETQHQFPGGAWLTNDEANHRIALLVSPVLSDDNDKLMHTGFHHSAFEYPSMGDLLDTYVRLKALGMKPHASLDHGITGSYAKFVVSSTTFISRERIFSSAKLEKPGSHR